MKFKYINLNNNGKLSLEVQHEDNSLVFIVKSLLDKTKKYQLDSALQFELLEGYINTKDISFKHELFSIYNETYNNANSILDDPSELFMISARKIVHMFDLLDIKEYVSTLEYIKAPSNLKEVFDERIIRDGIGTRVQTYIKDEYINLVTLSVISKALIGPFGNFLFMNPSSVIHSTKELSLMQMIYDIKSVFESNPVDKLLGGFRRTIETAMNKKENKTVMLSKMISRDDLPKYLLGIVIFKIMPVTIPRNDDPSSNMITLIFSSTSDALKPPNNYKEKVARSDGEETESSLEIFRMSTDTMIAYPVEFNSYCDDPHSMLKFYNIVDTKNVLDDALKFMNPITKSDNIDNNINMFLSWIVSITPEGTQSEIGIIDPEAIAYLDINRLRNMLALGFTIAYYYGFMEIALILTSTIIKSETQTIKSTLGKEQMNKDTIAEFKKYYKREKVLNEGTKKEERVNVSMQSINKFVISLYRNNYVTYASSKYLKGKSKTLIIPDNLRELIAMFIIKLHKGI